MKTKGFHVFLVQISQGPAAKHKAKAKPKASAEGKGPLGLKLAGKTLPDKIAAARWGLTSPFLFSISPLIYLLLFRGGEVKKELTALNTLVLEASQDDIKPNFKDDIPEMESHKGALTNQFGRPYFPFKIPHEYLI